MIERGIQNVDKGLIRDEHKWKVFADYFLPSLRFHLTVNELTETHLKSLDALCNRYLKKWSGLARPATLAFLHMPECLNIPNISDLYYEAQTQNYTRIRATGDAKVNHCLDVALERESQWTRKKSTVVNSNNVFESLPDTNATLPKQKKNRLKTLNYKKDHKIGFFMCNHFRYKASFLN